MSRRTWLPGAVMHAPCAGPVRHDGCGQERLPEHAACAKLTRNDVSTSRIARIGRVRGLAGLLPAGAEMVKSGGREGRAGRVSEQGEIHQHSGWLIPLGFAGVIVRAVRGLFLLYYLRPRAWRRSGTTARPRPPPWSISACVGSGCISPPAISNRAPRGAAATRMWWRFSPLCPTCAAIPTRRRRCSPAMRRIRRWCIF